MLVDIELVDTELYPYRVNIPWRRGDTINSWDQVCIDCVEQFGLPGSRYRTVVTSDYMEFHFTNETDALWFSLKAE